MKRFLYFEALAAGFVALELATCLGVSIGLLNIHALAQLPRSVLGAVTGWWRKPQHQALPEPQQEAAPQAVEAQRVPPAAEPSAEPTQPSSEPSAPLNEKSEPPQGFPVTEISFTFNNALAQGSSSTDGSSLAAVAEEDDSDSVAAAVTASEGDGEADDMVSMELVFEPSSTGMPGMRMLQRGISGLAVRTEPTSTDPRASPLLVQSYEGRFVEIVNGQVKLGEAVDPAYVSSPLAVAAHTPRRTASRTTLGPVASVSISPGASTTAL